MNRLRPQLRFFADEMERQLRENDHKGGWDDCSPDWLFGRLLEEAAELHGAIREDRVEDIPAEAADVANFAMMIADLAAGYGKLGRAMDKADPNWNAEV